MAFVHPLDHRIFGFQERRVDFFPMPGIAGRRRHREQRCQFRIGVSRLPRRARLDHGGGRVQLEIFEFLHPVPEPLHPAIAKRRGVIHHRRGACVGGSLSGFRGGVEKREKLIVFLLRDRIELVIMALRALHRQAENRRRHRVHLVQRVGDAVFLLDRAALVGVHAVAQETGGRDLPRRGFRNEIAGDLFAHELVVGLVFRERVDHPVAPAPHVAVVVDGIPVRVRVTRAVQPWQRETLGEMRRLHQAVDQPLPAVRRFVCQIGLDVLRGRRQSR